ncbi:MAG: NAD-dependent epimerase/dehydratase family protein [Opitutales bacterium]
MQQSDKQPTLAVLGAGYIGSQLAQEASKKGWNVWALTRNPERISELSELGVNTIQARTDDAGWESEMPDQVNAVVYCASSAARGVEGYRQSYVDGQKRALAWAEARGVQQYVYTSSTSVYGEAHGKWVDEESGPWSDTEYAKILLEAEKLVLSSQVHSAVLRLAGIYGPQRHLLWDRVAEATDSRLPGYGDTYLNLIHRDDCVAAIIALIATPSSESRVYNLADDDPATRQEIVDWCVGRLNKPRILFDPEMASLDKRAARFASGRRPNRRIRADQFKTEIGWKPKYSDFREGYQGIGLGA